MVAFRAESSFTRATARLSEHHHMEVPRSALYQATLRHGRLCRAPSGGEKCVCAAREFPANASPYTVPRASCETISLTW